MKETQSGGVGETKRKKKEGNEKMGKSEARGRREKEGYKRIKKRSKE